VSIKSLILLENAIKEQEKMLRVYDKHIDYLKTPSVILRVRGFDTCGHCGKPFEKYRFPNSYYTLHLYTEHDELPDYHEVEFMFYIIQRFKAKLFDDTIEHLRNRIQDYRPLADLKKDEKYLLSLK